MYTHFLITSSLYPPILLWAWFYFQSHTSGWIDTFGLKLRKRWEGNLTGDIFEDPVLGQKLGIVGFRGIDILGQDYEYLLGSALYVKIKVDSSPL